MANPITWKNINAPDFTGVARIQEAAGARFDSAFEAANKGLEQFNTHTANVQQNNDAIFRDKLLQAAQTPEQLQSMIQSGEVDALKSRFAGGLTRGKFDNQTLDNNLLADQKVLFNQKVDQLQADKDIGGLNALRDSTIYGLDKQVNQNAFNQAITDIVSKNQVTRGVNENSDRDALYRIEQEREKAWEKDNGISLRDVATKGTEEQKASAAIELGGREQRIQAPLKISERIERNRKELIDAGIDPAAAKAQADINVQKTMADEAISPALKKAKQNEYDLVQDNPANVSNPFVKQLFNPQVYTGASDVLSAETLADMTNNQKDALLEMDGWAKLGFIPKGSKMGNADADIPFTPELAEAAAKYLTTTGSWLGDVLTPGTRNATGVLQRMFDLGYIPQQHIDGYAQAVKDKTQIDQKYRAEGSPELALTSTAGINNLQLAAQAGPAQPVNQPAVTPENLSAVQTATTEQLEQVASQERQLTRRQRRDGVSADDTTQQGAVAARKLLDVNKRIAEAELRASQGGSGSSRGSRGGTNATSALQALQAEKLELETIIAQNTPIVSTGTETIADNSTPTDDEPVGLDALQNSVTTPQQTASTPQTGTITDLRNTLGIPAPAPAQPDTPTTLTGPETAPGTTQAAPLPEQAEPVTTSLQQEAALTRSGIDTSKLSSKKSTFMKPLVGAAEQAAQRLGTTALPILAMAALESGWNKDSKTLFGVKAREGEEFVEAQTKEFENGQFVSQKAKFKKYRNNEEAVAGFADLILRNPDYSAALNVGNDPEKFIDAIAAGGYATDPDYADKVKAIMKEMQGGTNKYLNQFAAN